MKIKSVKIRNFRRLLDLEFNSDYPITTIVGPNGVGKSSIFEAIRLCKSVLLQTQDNEATNALQIMGLLSPFNSLLANNITNNTDQPVYIGLTVELSRDEIASVKSRIDHFARLRIRSTLGGGVISEFDLVSYLSSEKGAIEYANLLEDTNTKMAEFEKSPIAKIELSLNSSGISGGNGFHQEVVRFALSQTKYSETKFSIFPADRSFPNGEAPIQIGQGDVNQQVQSYSINPQLKFQRLKTVILSQILLHQTKIEEVQKIFDEIFSSILPGKALAGISLDRHSGKLSVMIRESSSDTVYDIDYLSSGEKGLLLTIFLILVNQANESIVLIDEPELHLNPAICKSIIPFLKTKICNEKQVQIILTTHSGEILAATRQDSDLRLLHLIDPKTISPILQRDDTEANDALKALGVQISDLVFHKGVIYLEGITDETIILELLQEKLAGYQIKSLGGRTAVETEIDALVKADTTGEFDGFHVFVLDNDNKPTAKKSTNNVKIIQWDRYSFENYLLNEEVMYDVIKSLGSKISLSSRAEFYRELKETAISLLRESAILTQYGSHVTSSISLTAREVQNSDIANVAKIIAEKLETQSQFYVSGFNKDSWTQAFCQAIEKHIADNSDLWESNWKARCKGKELLIRVYEKYGVSAKLSEFTKSIARELRVRSSEEYTLVSTKFSGILK